MHPITMGALLALQCFEVLFLALHDWVPLGSLNDLKGVSTADSFGKRVAATLISAAPFVVGLIGSIIHLEERFPDWLFWWLWISYGLLFCGILQAWWIPYLIHPEPERAARYKIMFGATHAFLPERNGIRVNTLHVIFHAATVALLIVLTLVSAQQAGPHPGSALSLASRHLRPSFCGLSQGNDTRLGQSVRDVAEPGSRNF